MISVSHRAYNTHAWVFSNTFLTCSFTFSNGTTRIIALLSWDHSLLYELCNLQMLGSITYVSLPILSGLLHSKHDFCNSFLGCSSCVSTKNPPVVHFFFTLCFVVFPSALTVTSDTCGPRSTPVESLPASFLVMRSPTSPRSFLNFYRVSVFLVDSCLL